MMLLHSDQHAADTVTSRKNLIMHNPTSPRIETIDQTSSPSGTSTVSSTVSSTFRHTARLSAVVAACVAFSACGAIAEKVTEEGAERLIEAQSGEDVELDFDNGDGSFSVKTEDGSFAVNDNGEFVVTDADGSVFTGSASDDGLVVYDDDGDAVVEMSGDGEGGEVSLQGDDGEAVYRVVTDIPDEWPSDVPRPTGMTIDGGTYLAADGEVIMTLIGAPDGSAIDYTEQYVAALEAAGLIENGRFDSSSDGATTAQRSFENANWIVSINSYEDDSTKSVNISVLTNAG